MISSLVMDANRDVNLSGLLAKDIRSLTSQSEHAFNAMHCISMY